MKIGDSAHWPYFLMGDEEYTRELKCKLYHDIFGNHATCDKDLDNEKVTELYNRFITNLGSHVQNLFNQLAPEHEKKKEIEKNRAEHRENLKRKQQEEIKLRKAGEVFLKNNSVDYGGKTVSQIAQELRISKAEVRRRKQNGEL
jgi:LPS O-antigen subunit length determinant protein (WzzB/FepE family)